MTAEATLAAERETRELVEEQHRADIAALNAQVEKLRADAARYRWLRREIANLSNRWPRVTQYPFRPEIDDFKPPQIIREGRYSAEYLDEAVDAALIAPPSALLNKPAREALSGSNEVAVVNRSAPREETKTLRHPLTGKDVHVSTRTGQIVA